MTGDAPGFELLSTQHLAGLCAIAGVAVSLPFLVRRIATETAQVFIATALAAALVGHEIYKVWFHAAVYDHRVAEYLPLHLCGAASLLMAYVLVRRSYSGFEVGYFWGLAGSTQALLTPDIQIGFPSLIFFAFFVGHGLVILSVVYAIAVFGFKPRLASVGKTAVVTLLYMAVLAPLNYLLDANYLYLRHKPEQASLIDWLGPWPWYIGSLVVVGIAVCLVYYLPFALYRRFTGRT